MPVHFHNIAACFAEQLVKTGGLRRIASKASSEPRADLLMESNNDSTRRLAASTGREVPKSEEDEGERD